MPPMVSNYLGASFKVRAAALASPLPTRLSPHSALVRRFLMRKLAGVLIALVVIIVIAIFALPSLVNVNQYHDKIQAELQQKLHRQVKLGDMSLKLLPFSIRV